MKTLDEDDREEKRSQSSLFISSLEKRSNKVRQRKLGVIVEDHQEVIKQVSHRPSSSSSSSKDLTGKMKLLAYHDLPDWMKDNDCIKQGYRPQLKSTASCLKSMFSMHTETMNIWTHLIGCSFFMIMSIYLYARYFDQLSWRDMMIFGVYFVSIISCLLFSSLYHIFTCHSENIAQLCKRFDYCGISLLITGSFVSWTYYAFYSDITSKAIYLSIVTIIGLTIAVISLLKKFGASEFRTIRAIIYLIFGLSAGLPVIHYYFFSSDYVNISHWSMLSFGVYYVIGAIIYAMRFPERFFPGKFDIMFHSHQIFHVLIVIAAWIHLNNIQEIAFLRILQQKERLHEASAFIPSP